MRFNTIFNDINASIIDVTVEQLEEFVLEFGGWIDESYDEGTISKVEHEILVTALLDAEATKA